MLKRPGFSKFTFFIGFKLESISKGTPKKWSKICEFVFLLISEN